ncbi:hypothetical protein NLG97_g8782 [Lecanicillium saksenae]|uniref:Uncharacterized protein n=1 Tax=Lecanicillium saksenae TaxID=468837 RepID=A0ACC1QJJ9_9HYPO|nr:hypothetical protein NLG97_g8782 [Lecanicillium saksenae]
MSGPLFGLIPAGLPLITEPTSSPSPSSLLYALPSQRAFSHLVLFLLPGVSLPPGTAASIYLATAAQVAAAEQSGNPPPFRFLGAVGPGKESAMFKVGNTGGNGLDPSRSLVIGVSIEAENEVAHKMQELGREQGRTAATTVFWVGAAAAVDGGAGAANHTKRIQLPDRLQWKCGPRRRRGCTAQGL